jgi:hypothetical protein
MLECKIVGESGNEKPDDYERVLQLVLSMRMESKSDASRKIHNYEFAWRALQNESGCKIHSQIFLCCDSEYRRLNCNLKSNWKMLFKNLIFSAEWRLRNM